MLKQTIYALSTPYAKSAIAVIRVSGEDSFSSLEKITKRKNFVFQKTQLCKIYDYEGELLDKGIVVVFSKNASYTGEDLVEFHIHGSLSVINDLLKTLGKFSNHRMAEPGEFTRRALQNNKLNLIQAEGIADLIESQTLMQRKQALRELDGAIGKKYEEWYQSIKEVLALYEATIDFSDEDIPENTFTIANKKLDLLINNIKHEIKSGKKIKKIKQGISVAILGSPNVGKSSLINYFSNKDVAIVSNTPGTTRDIIEVFLDIGGFPVSLADTAGIRTTKDEIEQEGVRRAIYKAENCDIKIIMIDALCVEESYNKIKDFLDNNTFLVINKIDLNYNFKKIKNAYEISIQHKEGLKVFEKDLITKLAEITAIYENPIVLQERHNSILLESLKEIEFALNSSQDIIISSFHLRNSLNNLGKILGSTNIEDILDTIFSKFCIGK